MKIGLVLDDTLDKPDGVQASVITIGKELARRGHQVHYLVASTERTDIPNIHAMSRFISLRFNGNSVRTPLPTSKRRIRSKLSQLNLDVLHIQMPYSPFMAGRIISNAPKNTKVYGTFHILPYDSLTSFSTRILGKLLSGSLQRCDGFFSVSEPAKEFMKQSFGKDSKVLPNPVDYQYFHEFKKTPNSKKQIVYVGRFDKRKGVEQLLDAYSSLDKEIRKKTNLVMCGRGPLLEAVKQKSISKKLDVIFPGFVSESEKAQYLANADIAVFPSVSGESFGIVLVEAMSAKAGITMGGNNPGYASVLKDFPETLFNPNNIQEFSNTLAKFITDDKKRSAIGLQQHSYVKRFDTKTVVDQLLKEYMS